MRRKKKKTPWLLIVLVVVLAAVGGVCVWQRNNIKALQMSRSMSTEALAETMQTQQEKTEQAARAAGIVIRIPTKEETDALRSNTISREELIASIAAGDAADTSGASSDGASSGGTSSASGSEAQSGTDTQPQSDPKRDELNKLVAEVYVMQAEYDTWLEDANQAAIDEFNELPEESKSAQAKFTIGMRYMSEALAKEKECDAKMSELEGKIRSLLKQLGEDTALVDEIHNTYLEEKAAKKAYYLGLHN